MAAAKAPGIVDATIFEQLQADIDDDSLVREEIRNILQRRERQGKVTQSLLSRAHSVPAAELGEVLGAARSSINDQVETIKELSDLASKYPYYKYHHMWARHTQDIVHRFLSHHGSR
ncbi:MAG: hypothetical protein Q9178_003318 [Gyalolechia marmorata]